MPLSEKALKIATDIETEMPVTDVARVFSACLARLAADGRETFEAYQTEAQGLSESEKDELAEWLGELFEIEK